MLLIFCWIVTSLIRKHMCYKQNWSPLGCSRIISVGGTWLILIFPFLCWQVHLILGMRQRCIQPRPPITSNSSSSNRNKPLLQLPPLRLGRAARSPRKHLSRIKYSSPSSLRNRHRSTTAMSARLAAPAHRSLLHFCIDFFFLQMCNIRD